MGITVDPFQCRFELGIDFQFSRQIFALLANVGFGRLRLDLADRLKNNFRHKNPVRRNWLVIRLISRVAWPVS